MTAPADAWSHGDGYEPYIGRWSRLVAPKFLDWAALPPRPRAVDIGCGTGAVSRALIERGVASIDGIDLSPAYVEHASKTLGRSGVPARFQVGDATHLPYASGTFDAAVSGLALNFVPDPLAMVREMRRVLRPGGRAAVYVWDYAGRMDLIRHFWDAAVDLDPARAKPLDEAARFPVCDPERLAALFRDGGFHGVTSGRVDQPTNFVDFEDFWNPFLLGQGPAPGYLKALPEAERARLRGAVRARLPVAADGSIRLLARAWTVRGDA